ncbi:hypothetical protein BDI4_40079 [Burkholderia diffusa]|uniref:hypothetical protein n=1 Tax=Burkholderia diffusa TaxID=488732 RepID=UPI001CB5EA05|nr:hypothetical protein [Burkholderia diffusa]CAG9254015.1 hypothetical protein BDI4_40079 [Burkholderia diffusa]
MADVDAASAGDGFDWLGVAETVAGAALGSDDNSDGGDDTADSFAAADDDGGDTSTPLGDAQPFEYGEDLPGGDVQELAARGVSEADEAECFGRYELDMEQCQFARAIYNDPRTYAACTACAFSNYQSCRGY